MFKRLIIIVLILVSLTSFIGCETKDVQQLTKPIVAKEEPETTRRNILMSGPDSFKADIQAALDLIHDRTPEFYRDIDELVKFIMLTKPQINNSRAAAWANSAGSIYVTNTFYNHLINSPEDYTLPEYQLALTLIHETAHIRQIRDGLKFEGEEYEREREALAVERAFLTALGADPEKIEAVAGEHLLKNPWW